MAWYPILCHAQTASAIRGSFITYHRFTTAPTWDAALDRLLSHLGNVMHALSSDGLCAVIAYIYRYLRMGFALSQDGFCAMVAYPFIIFHRFTAAPTWHAALDRLLSPR